MEILSIRGIFLSLFGLYLFTLAFVFIISENSPRELNGIGSEIQVDEIDAHIETTSPAKTYRFSHPVLAYKIMTQLEALPATYNNSDSKKIPYMNLKTDDEYCDKHRQFISEYPESIFEELNFVSDGGKYNMVRNQVFPLMGNDIQPNINPDTSRTSTKIYDIKPEANCFFTRSEMHNDKKVGRHFSCITQMSNHVYGKPVLSIKSRFAEEAKEYAKRYSTRPQCFDLNKFYPQSYLLYRKQECKEFFKTFNSPAYQALKKERNIVYIRKLEANLHTGKGVEPVSEQLEREVRELYKNGSQCGKVNDQYIMQTYIHNPLLIHGRKFDFRIYLMLASVNPLIAHYHDGFLRVSLMPYDASSNDKKALLTNLGLNYQIYGDAKDGILYQGMDEEQLKHAQQWSFERLQDYLLETGAITDPNWLDNHLRPAFKKALVHLLRFSLINMLEHSSLFQIYGVDFMLDTDLNVWFIEANSKPGIGEYSQSIEKFMIKMLKDHIEIATSLLRSRMKRIVNYVNTLIKEGAYEDLGKGKIALKDLEYRRMVFKQITKNKFETEFEPSSDNGYSKIIDENYRGVERYMELIEEECL